MAGRGHQLSLADADWPTAQTACSHRWRRSELALPTRCSQSPL